MGHLLKSWAPGGRLIGLTLHLGDHCPEQGQPCAVLRVGFAGKGLTCLIPAHLERVCLVISSFSEWIHYDEFAQSHFV